MLDLLKGDGTISGTVVDAAGQPIAGAAVVASDGTNATQHGHAVGRRRRRRRRHVRAAQPDHPGHVLALGAAPTASSPPTSPCASTPGVIARRRRSSCDRRRGRTSAARSTPAARAPVRSAGSPSPSPARTSRRATTSLTTDPVGSWQVTGVPLPGTYTVTFSAAGYSTQAVGVELSPAVPENLAVTATLAPATSSVTGRVVEASNGAGIAGATVHAQRAGQTRTARTANSPRRLVRLRQPAARLVHDHVPTHRLARPDAGDHAGAGGQPAARRGDRAAVGDLRPGAGQRQAVRRRRAAHLPAADRRPGVPVRPADRRRRCTDADGNYAALGIPAGQYIVDLYINGQIQPPSQQASVSPGRPTQNVDFDINTAPPTPPTPTTPLAPTTTGAPSTTLRRPPGATHQRPCRP